MRPLRSVEPDGDHAEYAGQLQPLAQPVGRKWCRQGQRQLEHRIVQALLQLRSDPADSNAECDSAEGDQAKAATEAGADFVGSDDLAEKVEGGWTDFDVAIAHPSQMPKVGKLGRVLGPQGKMPNPKVGTVTDHIAKAVEEAKAGEGRTALRFAARGAA